MPLATVALLALSSPLPSDIPDTSRFESFHAIPVAAAASEESGGFDFSYTYVQLGFGYYDIHDFDDDSQTLYGRASLGLLDSFYDFLDYQNQSTDFQNTDTDLFGLGAGVHIDVSNRLNLLGEASWLTADVSSNLSNLDDNNDGWSAYAGGRFLALPVGNGGLEVNGGFRWIDIKGVFSDEEIGAWELGARYHFNKLLSLGGTYKFLEQDGFWGVDARVSF
jgi:hypothetical protein